MRYTILTLLIVSAALHTALAQQGGECVYPFLGIPASANYAGMGGYTPSAAITGPNQALANPALTDTLCHASVSANTVSYAAGIHYGSAMYSQRIGLWQLTAGAMVLNYGTLTETDEAANELGTFSCRDAMILVSASRPVMENLRAGVSAKYIISSMETYRSQGVALDMGLYYKIPSQLMAIGMAVQNLGHQLTTYSGTREKLPLDIRIGISKQLKHAPLRFSATIHDINRPKLDDDPATSIADHLILGAEIFPEGVFSLKGGFNFQLHNDLYVTDSSPFPGFSFGFDVRLSRFSVQYSHQCISPAAGANMFSLELFIGKFMVK